MITNNAGGELRIGDTEREAAAERLGEHFRAGRLATAEYDERVAEVWSARTRSALVPLFSDLPGGAPSPAPVVQRPAARTRSGPRPWVLLPVVLLVVGSIAFGALTHDHGHAGHPPLFLFALLWFGVIAVRRRAWAHGRGYRGPRRRW